MLFPLFPMPNSRMRQLHLLALALLVASMLLGTTVPTVLGFAPSPRGRLSSRDNSGCAIPKTGSGVGHQRGSVLFSAPNDTDTQKEENLRLLESIRSMRVKELKAELAERNISSADAFEKEELVQRLYKAKQQTANTPTPSATPASSPGVLRTNLFFTGVDTDRSMAGIASDTSERVTIRADAGSDPYPTVVLDVHDGNRGFPLKLLVDTACSGLVLRPSVVRRHSGSLKSYSTPVTMTGGAGAAASTGLTQVESFSFGGAPQQRLGPLPAAVQDIGALPLELDGILGLSVLGRYACVEFDLDRGCLALYENEFRPPLDGGDSEVMVAEAELSPTKLGIWTVDMSVLVEGTTSKPVKMLVDTGAMCTFLTHRGLEQTGISKSFVKDLTRPTGAMGSDNMAMSLTKRIELDANAPVAFGKRSNAPLPGLSLRGSLPIDIGNIGILDDQLATDNVVGILGMDVLSKASRIRMTVRGPIPRLTLYQKKQRFEAERGNASAESPKQRITADAASPTVESTATDAVTREKESEDGDDPIRASSSEPTNAPSSSSESVSSETEAEVPPPKKKKKKKKRRYD